VQEYFDYIGDTFVDSRRYPAIYSAGRSPVVDIKGTQVSAYLVLWVYNYGTYDRATMKPVKLSSGKGVDIDIDGLALVPTSRPEFKSTPTKDTNVLMRSATCRVMV